MLLCGMLFHRLLPRVFAAAFGHQKARGPSADADDWHVMMSSKVSRCLWYLDHVETPLKSAIVSMATEPIDTLMRSIQRLDHQGGILRLLADDEKNPFLQAAHSLAAMLREPGVRLQLILRHFERDRADRPRIANLLRELLLTLAAKLWYSFVIPLSGFPYSLVKLVIPAPEVQRAAVAEHLFRTPDCCLDADFSRKVKGLAGSADALMRHEPLLGAIDAWSRQGRLCNMHTERLLAAIRKATASKAPVAERLISAGTLSQVSTLHRRCGGHDPRKVTRKQVADMGAPLKSAFATRNPNMRRPHIEFINAKRAERRRAGIQLAFADFREEFHRDLDEFRAQPVARAPPPLQPLAAKAPAAESYKDHIGADLWGLSNAMWPISPESVAVALERALPTPPRPEGAPGPCRGGLSERLSVLRERCVQDGFVADENYIPSGWRYTRELPCRDLHCGICRHLHVRDIPRLTAWSKKFHCIVAEWDLPCFFRVEVQADGSLQSEYFCLAARFPSCMVLLPCQLEDKILSFHIDVPGSRFATSWEMLHEVRRDATSLSLRQVQVRDLDSAPSDMSLACVVITSVGDPAEVLGLSSKRQEATSGSALDL